jgi:hypothetical protein
MSALRFAGLAALGVGLAACAPSIEPAVEVDAGATGPVVTVIGADGVATTRIDATDVERWTYLALATGTATTSHGPWDLAFRRFHIKTNGGVSGDRGVEVSARPGALATLDAPPVDGWTRDRADGDDADAEPDYAFNQGDGWYAYDVATHLLAPRPWVWALRVDATVWKLVIDDYYDAAGTSGVFTLRWQQIGL